MSVTKPNTRASWNLWPLLAVVLACSFILCDLFIVNSTYGIRERINTDLRLLDELEQLDASIGSLNQVHKNHRDLNNKEWLAEISAIRTGILDLEQGMPDEAAIQQLIPELYKVLRQSDSLHREARRVPPGSDLRSRNEAIMNVLTSRSSKLTANAVRDIRQERLDQGIAQLSERWNWVQVLLVIACLFAIVLTIAISRNKKLLETNLKKSSQLVTAKQELEVTNQELRETMLSKEEKEVMIKEIHHRVKNNLQIVKSLIRFQMYTVDDEVINEKFNECVNRVSAMALVHERTYLSKDLANINVKDYLDQLIQDLIYSYCVNFTVEQDIDIQVETLTVDTLVPLGLLINEVISNAFKHAFQGRESGKITVHIHGEEETGLIVRIGDNGVGLPSKEDWSNHESLGMDLIHTLTTQLDGNVTLEEGPGTMYRLSTRSADAGIQVRA